MRNGTAARHARRSPVVIMALCAAIWISAPAQAKQVVPTMSALSTGPDQATPPPTPPPPPPPQSPPQTTPPSTTPPTSPPPEPPKPDEKKPNDDHIFGVLPNYTSVGHGQQAPPLTAKMTFVMAAEGAFDKVVYPFTAFTAGVAQLQGQEPEWGYGWGSYGKRYAMGFADNTLASFMTTAVAPTILRQDPRYFVRGEGGVWHRTGYALSRTFVTRSRAGNTQFNFSEILGNGAAAGIMNVYHPAEDRTVSATMNQWALQVLYDTITDVLKEFWPDIHHHFRKT
jgi:hypothetical protein